MHPVDDSLDRLFGCEVVIDVASHYVFLGTLTAEDLRYLTLENADVHDLRDTKTPRELYVVEAKRLGIRPNRKRVLVRSAEVVGISALEDVVE